MHAFWKLMRNRHMGQPIQFSSSQWAVEFEWQTLQRPGPTGLKDEAQSSLWCPHFVFRFKNLPLSIPWKPPNPKDLHDLIFKHMSERSYNGCVCRCAARDSNLRSNRHIPSRVKSHAHLFHLFPRALVSAQRTEVSFAVWVSIAKRSIRYWLRTVAGSSPVREYYRARYICGT